MPASIVCGVDHSDHARAAARLAARLSERLRLRLVLVHAVPVSVPAFMPAWPYPASLDRHQLRETAHRAGQDLVAKLREEVGAPDADCRVEDGAAPDRLCAAAEEEDAALIVVGTQGEGLLPAALLGSVSLATIRMAAWPVIVVPPAVAREGRLTLDGECLVCGVDGADDGPAHVAARLSRVLDLSLMLAHVVPAEDGEPPGGEARATLGAAVDAVRDEAARLDVPRMRAGDPAQQLSQLADQEDAALVVVGTHGRGPLGSRLLGSVSRDLACHGTAPVVVCPEHATVPA